MMMQLSPEQPIKPSRAYACDVCGHDWWLL